MDKTTGVVEVDGEEVGGKSLESREGGGRDAIVDAVRDEAAGMAKSIVAGGAEEVARKLTPEQAWFGEFRTRFNAIPQLHEGVQWADVEKSLKADPKSMAKLQAFDAKGQNLNVFGEENGEFIFASGWSDYNGIPVEHRNIAYDAEGQELAKKQGFSSNGNAVSIIAETIGVTERERLVIIWPIQNFMNN